MIYPALLLPAAMLAWAYFRWIRRRNAWRTLLVIAVVLLAGYPRSPSHASPEPDRRRRSLPVDHRRRPRQPGRMIDLALRNLQAGDRMNVVSFNAGAHVEAILEKGTDFEGFHNPYNPDASNLDDGLRLALELARDDAHNNLLVLSDGEFTGADPLGAASLAIERRIPIHYRLLKRRLFFDLAIRDARGPTKIVALEPFALEFDVSSTVDTPGSYRLIRDGRPVATPDDGGKSPDGAWRPFLFRRGVNTITFADVLAVPGTHRYALEVRAEPAAAGEEEDAATGAPEERVLDNNIGEHFVRVLGGDRVLVINQSGQPDNVTRTLQAGGVPVALTSIDSYPFELIYLQGYKAIVLNNVPIAGLRFRQIEDLARFVTQEGGGLVVTGGSRSFAGGGYHKTAVADVLPVSMELQQKTRRTATGMCFVLDRSGSMAMTVAGGVAKMDLANRGAAAGIEMLTENDSVSVIAVDSLAHTIVKQTPLTDPEGVINRVLRIRSMGGGILSIPASWRRATNSSGRRRPTSTLFFSPTRWIPRSPAIT